MGLLSLFSNKEVDEVARSLVREIAKRYPPTLDKPGARKISANRISRILEDIYARATTFQKERRLGIYKKARLSNTFKWELKELGYSDTFSDLATEGLVVYLARKKTVEPTSKKPTQTQEKN